MSEISVVAAGIASKAGIGYKNNES
jgi:hypothetical protein